MEKQRWQESKKRREETKKDQRRERVRRKKMKVPENEEKSLSNDLWPGRVEK